MSTTEPRATSYSLPPDPYRGWRDRSSMQWTVMFVLASIVIGAIAAVVWVLVVDLPGYTVDGEGRASITQVGLSRVFGADAWFSALGVPVGISLGVLSWYWFRFRGWFIPLYAAGGALLAGATCWQLGGLMGPGSFDKRLAGASADSFVEVDLVLHSPAALALWVMMAVLPVLFAATVLRDPEDSPPVRHVRLSETSPSEASVDGEDKAKDSSRSQTNTRPA